MELNFNKEKQRIAEMSDAELIARFRDPGLTATERMIIEAEISRRGVEGRGAATQQSPVVRKKRSSLVSNLFSIAVVVGIIMSIVAGILDDLGIDLAEWFRDFFSGGD